MKVIGIDSEIDYTKPSFGEAPNIDIIIKQLNKQSHDAGKRKKRIRRFGSRW